MQFQYGQHGGSWKRVRSCRVDPGDGGAGLFFKIYCKQQQQQEQTVTSMHSVCEQNDLNEKFGLIIDSSLRLACHLWLIFGSLSTDDGNVTENGKKATGLDWQSNNFARASHFFCTFFFLPSLRDYDVKMPIFTFCVEGVNTRKDFLSPSLNFESVFQNSTPEKNCQHLRINWKRWNKMQRDFTFLATFS